ncbi:Uncharacterised protein [Streptococcus gallolyticus]|uniref:HXXEE domain-containing protein n=1 Tax=Streptococcus gallolyticus TaxID=315405 RepID=A0AA94M0W2_9STRE|nr:HXXEE domain-containing protein [Streptococcus gallolyticus]AQP41314.1 hypothetical protein BTR42_01575 [Streptococcus gallolyticus subsp. gallolyticus DSM 16831]SQG78596.1 Uncharacterised protein [Streptococcus gallolyticus]
MSSTNWIYQVWPWTGLGFALSILILLLCTDFFRQDFSKSRWRDTAWLAWLGTFCYLFHNVEEYGVDMFGNFFPFPDTMEAMVGFAPPLIFYMAVNISMFWFASPIAAKMARKYPLMGMGMFGELFINAISHLIPIVTGTGYTAGTLTAVVIFLPASFWAFYVGFGKGEGKFTWKAFATIILIAIVNHLVMFVGLTLFQNGLYGTTGLVIFEILNATSALAMWYAADHFLGRRRGV